VRAETGKEVDHPEKAAVVVSEEIGVRASEVVVEDLIRTKLVLMLDLPLNTEERAHQEREAAEVSEEEVVEVSRVAVEVSVVIVKEVSVVIVKEVSVAIVKEVSVVIVKEDLEVEEEVVSEAEAVVHLILQLVLLPPLLQQLLQLPLNHKPSLDVFVSIVFFTLT